MVSFVLFSDIDPFVRYARNLTVGAQSEFSEVVPPDSRLFFTVRGQGRICVRGREYVLNEGDLLLLCGGTPYRILATVRETDYIAINFDYTRAASSKNVPILPVASEDFSDALLTAPCVFEDALHFSQVLYLSNMQTVYKRLSAIVGEYSRKLLYYEQKIGHMLAECLAECARRHAGGLTGSEHDTIGKLLVYIHENYAAPLTNRSIGASFDYHPNHVSFLIKRATGMPLHRYLLHVRFSEAISLLENTSLSVGDIALACGFCDSAHFSGCFKKHFGISPSKYRNV